MDMIKTYKSLCMAVLFVVSIGASNALAQTVANLIVANSTDATLTIQIRNRNTNLFAEVVIPPSTERHIRAPAGWVTFEAIASHSAPVLTYRTEFSLSTLQNYAMNLSPRDFGATFMSDRPSFGGDGTGITSNIARLAFGGSKTCNGASLEYGRKWMFMNPNNYLARAEYFEHSGYLCRKSRDGFYVLGNPMQYFGCSSNWANCKRDQTRDGVEKGPYKRVTHNGPAYQSGWFDWTGSSSSDFYLYKYD